MLKKSKKVIAIILALTILVYIAYAIYLLIVHPIDTYIIKEGSLSEEDSTVGFIIRDEEVIKGEKYENGIYAIATEGQKVAREDSIFRYYSDSEIEITAKINEIDYKIQELLEQEKDLTSSADIKAIENQIESKIENMNVLNNYQEITECKKTIDGLISKKIKFIGEITKSKEIKDLIKERSSYESQLKSGSEYKTSTISGIVSYRVDGLEEQLSEDKFNEITEEYLANIDLKTGQIIATSNESGKVIDNFKCYIATTMNSESAMQAKVGDSVEIRTSDQEEFSAKIVHINEEEQKRTIIFKINKMTEELISHRKIAVDVIWWNESGLKVPNQAIIEENGLNYVIRNKSGIQTKILVKLKRQTDKFSIITTYTAEELQEIGYDEKEIRNYKKVNNYDEIMINVQ